MPAFQIIRKFEDGMVELKNQRGQRFRYRMIECLECSTERLEIDFPAAVGAGPGARIQICNECTAAARAIDKAQRALRRDMLLRDRGQLPHQRRMAAIRLASPKWRDRVAIKAVYDEARKLTLETGVVHHVDHYYPLQGGFACGLHVHWNLRIMPASENCAKNNAIPMVESPAWARCSDTEIREFVRKMWSALRRMELKAA